MRAWPWALALIGCHPAIPPVKPVEAPASLALAQQIVTEGGLKHRLAAPDGAELVLLYGGEQAGRVGPCSCDQRPKGGLARSAAYAAAVRERDPNVLLLNVGDVLVHPAAGPNETARNALLVDGLERGGWDVWNLTPGDHAVLSAWGAPPAAISASAPDGPAGWRSFALGGLRVAVVGLAAAPGWPAPEVRLAEVLPALQAEAEVIVVLLHAAGDPSAVAGLPGVDVLIHAARHEVTYAPRAVGEAVVVKSRFETRRIGELRLHFEAGRVVRALDRQIDLDADLPGHPALLELEQQARAFGEVGAGG